MNKTNFFYAFVVTILTTIISCNIVSAQLACGTTEMTQKLLAEHPELLEKYNQYETYTQNWVKNYESVHKKATQKIVSSNSTIYIIPIVFHVLHQNGPENISDEQIFDEMRILNEDWGHMNPDSNTACTPHFKSIEGNIQVQFRLAQIDPNGNCTDGIDRIYTNRTNSADDLSKLNQWNPAKYVNVWVVKTIGTAGVAGYAYFPWEVDNNSLTPYDGVLILSQYIGSIGTSSPLTSRALTHEIGHVMNLEHPWGLTNSPGVACGDDGVQDTPDTKGWNHCPADSNAAKICDTISHNPVYLLTENYQNFMDYSYCSMMFTQGQRSRIYAALNSYQAGRSNLWDTANLIATGVYNHPAAACIPQADFYSNTCFVCQGGKVGFYDATKNAEPTSWAWTFTGASVNSTSLQNPVVTFDSLWHQTVSLTAYDSTGNNTQTKYGYVYVSPLWSNFFGTYSEGFENPAEVNSNWIFVNNFNNSTSWKYTNTASSTGSGSLMLNSYSPIIYSQHTNPPYIVDAGNGTNATWDAITPSIDLQTSSAMTLSFDYSCASATNSVAGITESLEIDYSLDCGATWAPIKTIIGPSLITAGSFSTSFAPSSPRDWQNISMPISSLVNDKLNVRFRFRYTSGLYSNNLYIDNVNLSGTVGIDQVNSESYNLTVYPNPASNKSTISYSLPSEQAVSIGVYDIAGRELMELSNGHQSAGMHVLSLQSENLSNGMYFIKMNAGNSKTVTKKLIVIK